MPRTRQQLDQAAAETEAWLDTLDPDEVPAEDPADLRDIGRALIAMDHARVTLDDAVAAARRNGRSWTEIATILGVSRQAARQRFGELVEH